MKLFLVIVLIVSASIAWVVLGQDFDTPTTEQPAKASPSQFDTEGGQEMRPQWNRQ